jgi:hypothetical protein
MASSSELIRRYLRAVLDAGHRGVLDTLDADEAESTARALDALGVAAAGTLLREARRIDAASRGSDGTFRRDYLEVEERSLRHLDRELYGLLDALRALAPRSAA